jgi:hypothetical protein
MSAIAGEEEGTLLEELLQLRDVLGPAYVADVRHHKVSRLVLHLSLEIVSTKLPIITMIVTNIHSTA